MQTPCKLLAFVGIALAVACDGATTERGSGAEAVPPTTTPEPAAVAPVAAVAPTDCSPALAPPERVAGTLTVRDPPDADTRNIGYRLRSHSSGSLGVGSPRTWVGPPVPGFVPLLEDDAELHLLLEDDGNVIGFYRDMYGATTCGLSESTNCDFFMRAWDRCGKLLWARRLNDSMSRPDRLEVQDVRVADGVVYFNEACQSYSKEAEGKCSALVALDPLSGQVLWRTPNLVSNGEFLVHGAYLITGYGFTAEADYLHIVRRKDGEVVHRTKLDSGHQALRVEQGELVIARYYEETERFLLEGFEGDSPSLVRAPDPKANQPARWQKP